MRRVSASFRFQGDYGKSVGRNREARSFIGRKACRLKYQHAQSFDSIPPSVETRAALIVAPAQLQFPTDAKRRADAGADCFRVFLRRGCERELWNVLFKVGRKLQRQFTPLVGCADFELDGGRIAPATGSRQPPEIAHHGEARRGLRKIKHRDRALEESGQFSQLGDARSVAALRVFPRRNPLLLDLQPARSLGQRKARRLPRPCEHGGRDFGFQTLGHDA